MKTPIACSALLAAMLAIAKVRAKQPQVIMNNRLFRIPEAGFSGMGKATVIVLPAKLPNSIATVIRLE